MKQLLILSIAILVFVTVKAQQNSFKIKKTKMPDGFIGAGGNGVKGSEVYAFNDPNSKFLFENGEGKVYESLLDNMRFLAPEFHSNMPHSISNFKSNMPVKKMGVIGLHNGTVITLPEFPPRQ
ncbi:MAG TPA: hypothetical protein VMU83_06575 [Hanamia sp.]|nr:hypothetical protein [Hanamia sp.]